MYTPTNLLHRSLDLQEFTTRLVNLPEDDPETIERMLSHLYIENYSEDSHIIPMDIDGEPKSSQPNIGLNNADVCIVADKYDIQPLKVLAASKLSDWAHSNANSSGFFVMARHILQLEHDPWPRKLIAECIAYQLGPKLSGNDGVTNLMRVYGVLGLTVLELVDKSHVFPSDELKDSHAREEFISRPIFMI